MKKISYLFNIFFDMLCVLLILAGAALLVLNLLDITPNIVLSGSMEPAIHVGSVCFVDEKVPYGEIKKDDIIAFKLLSGNKVTHRVITLDDEGMVTKGDANDTPDIAKVTEENYIGKTFFSIPYIGYLIAAIRAKKGSIVFITVIAALFIMRFIAHTSVEGNSNDGI